VIRPYRRCLDQHPRDVDRHGLGRPRHVVDTRDRSSDLGAVPVDQRPGGRDPLSIDAVVRRPPVLLVDRHQALERRSQVTVNGNAFETRASLTRSQGVLDVDHALVGQQIARRVGLVEINSRRPRRALFP